MNSTIVLTSVYSDIEGAKQLERSCDMVGLPLINVWPGGPFRGNHVAFKAIYQSMLSLRKKYDNMIYSDGADTFFVKSFTPPQDRVIYSAEKACYPIVELAKEYPEPKSPWRFLNSGQYCGPIDLVIEFYKRYGLDNYDPNLNAQYVVAVAYLQALKDGFPIELDERCEYFQSIAFEAEGDFKIEGKTITNQVTGTQPCAFHGNGLTPMDWIYKLY
jgi:hypothetical protein